MATQVLGLTDSEIDRLLAEAESRLAAHGDSQTALTAPTAPAAKALTAVVTDSPALLPSAAGDQKAVSVKESDKLSVRVPQPSQKSKGTKDTTGESWFNMPRTDLTPELKRDLQLLRLRDVAAMGKQFFKKDSKKDFLPSYCQVGTIIAGATDGADQRLTRKEKKRTIVEEVLAGQTVANVPHLQRRKGHAKMNMPPLICPLRSLLQGRLHLATARSAQNVFQPSTTQFRTNASVKSSPSTSVKEPSGKNKSFSELEAAAAVAAAKSAERALQEQKVPPRMPRSLEALYLKPLRREAEYGVPSCDLQMRSYSVRNLEFFCDFALRAAYYLGLPAFGPVPLPRITERWTVPKSTFIFKKSQENFSRTTLRRLIQIRDGHPETVQVWLAFLQKHAYYGIGMKANVWEFSKLDVGKNMNESMPEVSELLKDKWDHLGYVYKKQGVEDLHEFLHTERVKASATTKQAASPTRALRRLFSSSLSRSSRTVECMPMRTTNYVDPPQKIIFSGIQPTGVPHLGNYLGALHHWKRMQDEAEESTRLFFSVVDLHAITVPRPKGLLKQWKREMVAALLAIGLNPAQSTIFYQSMVPAHSELQWILSCTASTGYLSRMTQWKHGLFSYPILQAADILVHRATHVPVGEDQRQHLEFARECVTNFNHAYGVSHLVAPSTILSPAKRVMSLTNPLQKMSKSDPDPRSRILLTDAADVITSKIKSSLTDSVNSVSWDPVGRPGVANLLTLLSHLDGEEGRKGGRTAAELGEGEFAGKPLIDLKMRVAELVNAELQPVRERFHEFMAQEEHLDSVIRDGAMKARESAENTMKDVREAVELGG
ncbi:hypothetical protein B0H67DRAFT_539899 [Lasiosphaeris hirsuta]|uniref:Small ribosomal subunit protein uS10m n=1 Tax=Lasiosphaeris hirsuta TaxID=260670 RepID=A0AA40A851_9PEZI|nr:hypothetical protein B0H67DRAFT_539899 [Lasiosphaeris hirsuta]